MKRTGGWAALAVVSLIIALLLQTPAQYLYTRMAPLISPNGITLSGLSGTVWRGTAAGLNYRQQPLGQIAWDIHFMPLLIGKLSGAWTLQREEGNINGTVTVDRHAHMTLQDVTGTLSPAALLPLLPFAPFTVDGMLKLNLKEIEIAGSRPITIVGDAQWQQAQLTISEAIDMGTVQVALATDPASGEITADISNQEGVVDIQSSVKLMRDGNYKLSGEIGVRHKRDAHLLDMLAIIGRPDRNGTIRFSQAGRI